MNASCAMHFLLSRSSERAGPGILADRDQGSFSQEKVLPVSTRIFSSCDDGYNDPRGRSRQSIATRNKFERNVDKNAVKTRN